jgi:hypothetical protein
VFEPGQRAGRRFQTSPNFTKLYQKVKFESADGGAEARLRGAATGAGARRSWATHLKREGALPFLYRFFTEFRLDWLQWMRNGARSSRKREFSCQRAHPRPQGKETRCVRRTIRRHPTTPRHGAQGVAVGIFCSTLFAGPGDPARAEMARRLRNGTTLTINRHDAVFGKQELRRLRLQVESNR